ncbi:DndE family protein [Kurthia zopfii]|uniref:DndE family protein n=1 Tax=Kurthia zopfii TaxID=1650 RepID=UPI000F6ED159|nr:DndE family protein [Kurthia zopfii]VEI08063.1 DNA sulfur modification protein DndE [Kurthia zopfii]
MNFRLKTSKKAAELLKELSSSTGYTWNVLSRISVALSLKIKEQPEAVQDSLGVDINRTTMTGEYDYIYKALITQHLGHAISDDEYFPALFNAHLERGIIILHGEYTLAGNTDRLLTNLFKL